MTFDAIAGLELTGRVSRIRPIGENKQGDITYVVRVTPDRQDARLRWDMTAAVSITAS
jgi:HlyD family secretion protein